MARRYVPVAEVARPHGVRGELRLKVYNRDSDLLLRRPRVKLLLEDGGERDATIDTAREVNKAILLRLVGVDDRDAADALRGVRIAVARDEFPPLDEGEFYACDVEGARVLLPSGEEIGRVAGLSAYPTCDVLLVDRTGEGRAGKRLEVPLVDAYVASVDVERGVVELVTIDGLG